ncbi:Ni,Fe-hydrogenase I large subunit [Cryptobacterium curtum DSM 15641]|uniref:Ni,Fe-hydrogenase I large subunit n=1 Tax=Cryptobacterium curtum (strain ATCC 700683 / DSM 15641 / CCUG 43107 / 12-3) TaxID=469378 RepID=C7MNR6_CRYCD|nr:nickel-dependent hydrogenase large subunit [Cryptobacterium curtum]ACU94556.1 Ni,Fe-hydrogenase I large subunit [Cryptobacterium curtum DSM 15641]
MARTVIDPITRIEGHLRVEMEVNDGMVTDAWVSGGCFRGMELVVRDRTPEDAAMIVQRICGVCPVSHAHSASIAGEKAYGITISNNARIIRNLVEAAQFMHSNILWFYNLAALDYVNPLNALTANVADAYDLAQAAGTSTMSDLGAVKKKLQTFAANKQLSIFSGNWFDAENNDGYQLTPELDLICTAHYLEALRMQAKASEIAGLLGGKMPHIMTSTVGGTMFVPTEEKLDDLWALVNELYDWVEATMLPDTLAIAPYYADAFEFGRGCGRYIAWGVFDDTSFDMTKRYLPAGVLNDGFALEEVNEDAISEYVGHSWYEGSSDLNPREGETKAEFTSYDVADRYSWVKAPTYNGKAMEATSMSRMLVAYKRGVPFIVEHVDALLEALGAPGRIDIVPSTMGRTGVRQIETLYIAGLMKDWVRELIEAIKGGDTEYFRPPTRTTGEGSAFWEAPRGALYHTEKVKDGKITDYQIIIPSTWNLAPINGHGEHGPLEQALIGVPVTDLEKPINALRTVHSFDPCTACSVHITEPATGKKFQTVTNPWGVR